MCSIILETDANSIASKVASHSIDSGAPLSEQVCSSLVSKILPMELCLDCEVNYLVFALYFLLMQTISQALANAREHLVQSLLK